MTYLLDTEGDEIPKEVHGRPYFDADLCDWNDGTGPALTMNVPMSFEGEIGVYDGNGVVSAPLQDVLEQYLRDFKREDGGIALPAFIAWLRDYANRLEAAHHG
jgi:hypothetical protein